MHKSNFRKLIVHRRVLTVAVALFSLVVVAHLLSKSGVARRSPATRDISLILNGHFGPHYAGEMYASRSSDLYEREKIRISIKAGATDEEAINSVAEGGNIIGVTSSESFLGARSKGAPIVAFAASLLESPVVFYALRKSGIHSPQDFVSKRVARFEGKDTALIYDALLANAQISRGLIHEVAGGMLADLEAGTIDVWPGYYGNESYLLRARGISYDMIRPSDFGIHVPGLVYFASENFVRDNPAVIEKFLRAIIAGWNAVYTDYSKSVPLIVDFDKKLLSADRVRFELVSQRDLVIPLARRIAEFDQQQWQQLRIILLQERLINEELDMTRAISYDFLKEAYRKSIFFGSQKN